MGLYQTLYFTSLVGAIAGLSAWTLQAIFAFLVPVQAKEQLAVLTATALLGMLICSLTVAFSDRWSGNRVQGRWMLAGATMGLLAGGLAGALQIPLRGVLPDQPQLAVVAGWMTAGAFIGLALGLRWLSLNRARVAHGLIGGLAGGFLGGLAFALLGNAVPDISQALAYILTGAGISFGIAYAPILLRDAVLQFLSSGDPRAASALKKTQWDIHEGDSYLIGSKSAATSKTLYGPEVDIYIKDAAVAPRHARLFGKDGRFFVVRHPDLMSEGALKRYVLRVQERSVTAPRELHHEDAIMVGQTILRFLTKRGQAR